MANSSGKSAPRDAHVMAAIIKDSGIPEHESRLMQQMLEFTYGYVTDVLEDAKVYGQHANKKMVDADDVRLSVQCKTDHSFANPPPKELLQEIARQKNSQPLPPIKPYGGPRSIPDRYCLTNPNFRVKSKKPRFQLGVPTQQRLSLPSQAKSLTMKGLGSSGGQSLTVLPKASPSGTVATSQVTIINKPAIATVKPTIRINTGSAVAAGIGASGLAQIVTTPISTPTTTSTSLLPTSIIASSTSVAPTTSVGTFNPLKCKAEDDDYDA